MTDRKDWSYFANGKFHQPDSQEWMESFNPTTGSAWARIADCNAVDVGKAVLAARAAFETGPFSRMNATERGRLLARIADSLRKHADKLGLVETIDSGKNLEGIQTALKGWLTDIFEYYSGLADKIEGSNIPVDVPNVLNYTRREPFGVVGCITAWNSPLLIAIWKISAAIAAGNTIVLKPSEFASVSTLAMMDILSEADLPPGLINVVTGGTNTGAELVKHPEIRLISFTGGVAGGKAVAKSAAENLKPVILELGGKSPQIVLEDADIELAARGIVAGIFPPAGQSCIAGSRVLVHHDVHDALFDRLVEITNNAIVGEPAGPKAHVGPIANKPHFDRILRAIKAAKKQGAICKTGGFEINPTDCGGWFVAPTIFTEVSPNMDVAREEIFGPVLAVLSVKSDEEAIQIANDSDYGLAAGIWSKDSARALRIAHRIEAGTVYINNYFSSAPQSPVGGFKASGYGRENGIEGLLAFTQTKSVWLDLDPHQEEPFT
ncbi:MAG: aldehyde dehydrogenase [Pseudomonadota bacterium]